MPTFIRVLIALCVSGAAILAWQSYGDAARQIIASSYSQLVLAPRTAPVAYSAPDQQRFDAISIDLDAIREIVDRIAVTQEQITRNVDQLTIRQEQMMREINKQQAAEQQNGGKNSASLLPLPPSSPRQKLPVSAQALTEWSDRVGGNGHQ
jgi:hypothetical protein